MSTPVVTVSGDAAGGFITEVHDGAHYGCYPVLTADAVAAQNAALAAFAAEFTAKPAAATAPSAEVAALQAELAAVKAALAPKAAG